MGVSVSGCYERVCASHASSVMLGACLFADTRVCNCVFASPSSPRHSERVRWCRANDAKCQDIVSCARKFYDVFVSREGLLDYGQLLCERVGACLLPSVCDHADAVCVCEGDAEEVQEDAPQWTEAVLSAAGLPVTFGRKRPRR